jgi:predicted transcriptional regulator
MNNVYLNILIDQLEESVKEITDEDFDKRSSITSKGGRPYLFSPSEISKKTIEYFRYCVDSEQPFMVTGLCLYIGISRRGLLKLEKSSNERFVPIIEKGKQFIESYLEMQCHSKQNPAVSIFILKNMGWH